jgi:hypothetical protein
MKTVKLSIKFVLKRLLFVLKADQKFLEILKTLSSM